MPAVISPYALTTVAVAKEHLGIPGANTSFDDRITRLINAATGNIETYCDRFLKQRLGLSEFHDGIAHNRLLLGQWPIQKPSEVWVDPTGTFTDVKYKLDASVYEVDFSAKGEGIGIVLLGNRFFPKGVRNIKVVYDGGYQSVPAELEDACLWTVDFFQQMLTERSIDTESKGKNQENTTYREELPRIVRHVLDAYRRTEWSGQRVQTW